VSWQLLLLLLLLLLQSRLQDATCVAVEYFTVCVCSLNCESELEQIMGHSD
jgi:hypothetical protein